MSQALPPDPAPNPTPPTEPPATPATPPVATPPTEPPATPPWGDDFDPERAWALIQKLRGSEREAEQLRAKIKEHDDAQKTDQQKLEERTTTAEQTARSASLEASRLRVALNKGLTETQAKRLLGSTEAELEADADELLASFKTDDGQDLSSRPRQRLRPGASPSAEPEENDPLKLAALVPRT